MSSTAMWWTGEIADRVMNGKLWLCLQGRIEVVSSKERVSCRPIIVNGVVSFDSGVVKMAW